MNYNVHHRSTHFYYRNDIIGHLDQNYHLLSHICSNLNHYVQKAKVYATGKFFLSTDIVFFPGGGDRDSHVMLIFLRLIPKSCDVKLLWCLGLVGKCVCVCCRGHLKLVNMASRCSKFSVID